MTDYKQLCVELLDSAEELDDLMEGIRLGNYMPDSLTLQPMRAVLARARAALAEPEPEVTTPSDEELMALAVAVFEYEFATDKDYARAVLARWGK